MNANITALKGTEFKVFTKTQEEYDKVLRILNDAGLEPFGLVGFSKLTPNDYVGLTCFTDNQFTDGTNKGIGFDGAPRTTFTASEFITANK